MKRSRSGARPSGGAKTLAKHHTRCVYALCVYTDDGELAEPTAADMRLLRERHPELSRKMEESAQDVRLAAGSWQEKCFLILDSILKQKRAGIFKQPVDPVKEHLPDYFTVIKNPMDLGGAHAGPDRSRRRAYALTSPASPRRAARPPAAPGTIKTRLLGNYYTDTDGFAIDMRLTFGNAMAYNVAHTNVRAARARFDSAPLALSPSRARAHAACAACVCCACGRCGAAASRTRTPRSCSGSSTANTRRPSSRQPSLRRRRLTMLPASSQAAGPPTLARGPRQRRR
jgi:hypothetical protein